MSEKRTIKTPEELGKAIKEEADTIEIEGDLSKKTIKIRATGKVAWAVCLSCLTIAVAAIISTGGAAAPVSFAVGSGAVATLGVGTALAAASIAAAAGGVGALNKLRDYEEISRDGGTLVLKRK